MNAKNVKPHFSIDDSLEVFTPFPAYRDSNLEYKIKWVDYLLKLFHFKH